MTMPIDLVLLRHGQSEGNYANILARQGDDSLFTPDFVSRHSSTWHLTPLGVKQAKIAGQWIKNNIYSRFDRYYVSEYARALETAANTDFPKAEWMVEFYLRERDRGWLDVSSGEERKTIHAEEYERQKRDGFLWAPFGGESVAWLCLRDDRVIETLHRECSSMSVLIVCHGETMWGFRVRLERMLISKYHELEGSKEEKDKIHNCQVIHYTRRDPKTGVLHPYLSHFRSVCPWDMSLCDPSWQKINRAKYSNEDLLEIAGRI